LLADSVPQSTVRSIRNTLIALKSQHTYAVAHYRIDAGQLNYVLASGAPGAVDIKDVDWVKTSQLNGDRWRGTSALAIAQAN
jgi:hypothetical protein